MRDHAKNYYGALERLGMVYVGMLPIYKDEVLDSDMENGGSSRGKHGESTRDEDGIFVEEFWGKVMTSV